MIAVLLAGCTLASGEKTATPPKAKDVTKPAAKAPAKPAVKTKIVEPGKAKVLAVPENEKDNAATSDENAVPEKLPEVEDAIPGPVKALGEPTMMNFPSGIRMAVTAATENAQIHVNQGMNHLHGGWEFEASRHFAAAMREDPDCLLAHWGMVMSLLTPSPETGPARNAATDRMLDLVSKGYGTELERGYVYGLIKYIEEGPKGAAIAFRKVADQFPNDVQAAIFASLFGRGGYDEMGSATPDQEASEKILKDLIEKNPLSPLPLNALLTIRAEAPDLQPSVALARKLCQIAPEYPSYFQLLGHYEWRCGEHGKAASAFGRAGTYFEAWMKDNKVGVADCPEWVKAECYRVVSLVSKGDFDTAYAASRQVAATPIPKDRLSSPGARILLWDAKTLPARILLHRGMRGNAKEALNSLPTPTEIKETRETSLAYWWIDGLRFALEAQRLTDEGKFEEAKIVVDAFTHHGEAMTKTQNAASQSGERSPWSRSFRALEVLASDLRGRLVMSGPKEGIGSAYNWFASACDRQRPAPMMFPPMVLTPMPNHLGEYYLAVKKPAEAVEAYERSLAAFPNDMNALVGLKTSYEQAKHPDKASATEKKIQALRDQ